MKSIICGLPVLLLALTGCESLLDPSDGVENVDDITGSVDTGATVPDLMDDNKTDHDSEEPVSWSEGSATEILLQGQTVVENSDVVLYSQGQLKITGAGVFRLSGELEDAQVIVDTEDDEPVILVLNGVDLNCSTSAPLYIANAACTVIELASQTENSITDNSTYIFDNQDDDEPNAALFSKDDLTITGEGALVVNGNYEDGIASKDGLVIKSGDISVTAVDDGIRGKDYLVVKDGNLIVDAGGDGIVSTNDEENEKGYVWIVSGTVQVTAGGDAIQAETDALISEVHLTAVTGGGAEANSYSDISSKGIKGNVYTVIDGGIFSIVSADDAVHSNDAMIINGGQYAISTGDDAFHADAVLVINDGQVDIATCYEGVESAVIDATGGSVVIVSSDDGINIASGNDGSGTQPWMGGPGGGPGGGGDQFSSTGDYYLFIEGGYFAVNSQGDGIDINGAVVMSGGELIVDGPTANNNGALDFDRSFAMNGGFLLATGSSGMAQVPGTSSEQYSMLVNFNSTLQAGTPVHLSSSSGTALFTYTPTKRYQSVAFSSPDLVGNSSYEIYYGGTVSGTTKDGLLTEGAYTPGTRYREFTISGITTTVR